MRIFALGLLGVSFAALIVGCGASEPGSSTITGTIDQASFPAPVSSISVISDSSAPTSAAVAADGSFSLSLLEGASYRFTLGPKGTIPLILRNDGARLQTMIAITGGDATASLGKVRYWGGSASDSASPTSIDPIPGSDSNVTNTCVDGQMTRTGQPCSTGAASVTCEGGEHHGRKGMHHPGGEHHGRKGMHHPGGGHNGPPPPDALPTFDASTDAAASQAVAIPESTLVTGIGCGGCPGM